MEIKKVRREGKQKIVCIPIKSEIEAGDYVKIEKLNCSEEQKNI